MTTPQGNSIQHILFFLHKIQANEPFCFVRPGDGEYMILQGINFKTIDNWQFNGSGSLKADLKEALHKAADTPLTYIGIPCPCDNIESLNYFVSTYRLTTNKTYANLVCNRNWPIFTYFFLEGKVPFYFIGPKITCNSGLNVIEAFEVDELLVNKWDEQKAIVSSVLRAWMKGKSGIFCFSVGPIAKIWASELFREFPGNIMMDIGSAFDKFFKGSSNRDYANGVRFHDLICDFKE